MPYLHFVLFAFCLIHILLYLHLVIFAFRYICILPGLHFFWFAFGRYTSHLAIDSNAGQAWVGWRLQLGSGRSKQAYHFSNKRANFLRENDKERKEHSHETVVVQVLVILLKMLQIMLSLLRK